MYRYAVILALRKLSGISKRYATHIPGIPTAKVKNGKSNVLRRTIFDNVPTCRRLLLLWVVCTILKSQRTLY
jgi:hypothetical protein